MKPLKKVHKILLAPTLAIAQRISSPEHRRTVHIVIGLVLMILGSYIVGYAHGLGERHAVAEILADTFGFGIHGFGAAPLIKSLGDWLKIEV